jgi:sirohydrochlorin ferrochelatase
LLVGHGAPARPQVDETVARHAAELRARGRFRAVRHAFLEGGPDPAAERAALGDCAQVLVLPLFMSDGYFVRRALPQRLGEGGADRLRICRPLGGWPGLAALVGELAQETRKQQGWADGGWDLLLAAHGSTASPASRRATETLAGRLIDLPGLACLRTGYLEEPPYLTATAAQLVRPTVVVGLFAADGGHAADDVPEALAGSAPPVVCTGAIGGDPRVPDLLQDILESEIAKAPEGSGKRHRSRRAGVTAAP